MVKEALEAVPEVTEVAPEDSVVREVSVTKEVSEAVPEDKEASESAVTIAEALEVTTLDLAIGIKLKLV